MTSSCLLQNVPEPVIEEQVAAVASAQPGLAAPPSASPAASPVKAEKSLQELEDSIAQYIVDEKPIPHQGTLVAKALDAKTDCEVLRKAMKGLGMCQFLLKRRLFTDAFIFQALMKRP